MPPTLIDAMMAAVKEDRDPDSAPVDPGSLVRGVGVPAALPFRTKSAARIRWQQREPSPEALRFRVTYRGGASVLRLADIDAPGGVQDWS
jgi:hypothetical protein